MNKKFAVSVVALFVLSMLLGFIVHGWLLHDAYVRLPNLFRSETDSQAYFGYMLLAHLFMAGGITWVYRRGHEAGKPYLMQGLRFGLALIVLMTIPGYLIYFAVQPMPSDLVAMQIVMDSIAMLIMGVAAAALNKS